MSSRSALINGVAPAGARSVRAGAARWMNGWSRMLHYATVFTIVSVTMVIMGFGSVLSSMWSDED